MRIASVQSSGRPLHISGASEPGTLWKSKLVSRRGGAQCRRPQPVRIRHSPNSFLPHINPAPPGTISQEVKRCTNASSATVSRSTGFIPTSADARSQMESFANASNAAAILSKTGAIRGSVRRAIAAPIAGNSTVMRATVQNFLPVAFIPTPTVAFSEITNPFPPPGERQQDNAPKHQPQTA